MDRIELDFARRRPPTGILGWLLLLLGGAVLLGLIAWRQIDQAPHWAARQARLDTLQAALDKHRPTVTKIDDKVLAADLARALAVANDLNQPWGKLFAVLEEDVNRPVALLVLEPQAAKRELMLTAEAKNFDEMLSYYRYLQQQEMLHSVVLHTHQVNQQDRERPINFRITATWAMP